MLNVAEFLIDKERALITKWVEPITGDCLTNILLKINI
jgi:hypothetical protein